MQDELQRLRKELTSAKLAIAGCKGANVTISQNYKRVVEEHNKTSKLVNELMETLALRDKEIEGLVESKRELAALRPNYELLKKEKAQLKRACEAKDYRIKQLEEELTSFRISAAKKPWWKRLFW